MLFFTQVQYSTNGYESFAKSATFNIIILYLKTVNLDDIRHSTACLPVNFDQDDVWLRFPDRVFGAYNIPEGTESHSPAKSPEGKLGQWPWLTSDNVKRNFTQVYVKNQRRIRSQDPKK